MLNNWGRHSFLGSGPIIVVPSLPKLFLPHPFPKTLHYNPKVIFMAKYSILILISILIACQV